MSTSTLHPPITTATVITWLVETGRVQPGESIVNMTLSESERSELREWAARHAPDRWEQDGEKSI